MKIEITFSTSDLFNAEHVKMLEKAKRYYGYLITGLQIVPTSDRPQKKRPTQRVV